MAVAVSLHRLHASAPPRPRGDGEHGGFLSPLDRLSQELLDAIVDELRDDAKSLKTCTLSYRRWFSRSSAHLLASCVVAEMPRLAMQPPQRIQNHLVKLTVEPHIMQHLELITALPRLSELVVSCFGLDMDTFDSRAAILRTSTGRAIDSITVSYARPEVVELLMRLFVDVQTLRWKWCLIVPDGNPKFLASPLAVRNLEVINCSGIFLPYVAHMLAKNTVESLKVELIHHIDGGHEAFLDDFIQWFPHLNAYHHIDISGLSEDIRGAFLYTSADTLRNADSML